MYMYIYVLFIYDMYIKIHDKVLVSGEILFIDVGLKFCIGRAICLYIKNRHTYTVVL